VATLAFAQALAEAVAAVATHPSVAAAALAWTVAGLSMWLTARLPPGDPEVALATAMAV
jgi:hypothetical protein